ncbi:iron-sulfur cluster assembly scaffold protein [Sphingomonas rhizophila]|uniref:Iron-sulfur cluster assembly scaffold protein n=1 Tax=Sphingomonas rhizophila TaxID=2071607 RepID=A0A7G9SCC4_9SPHN|nr:iron-sulfur cluster assembly scaffold protein [Sphingomonas rhizophila]QNN65499.1 iron-sulfur cluster assembly scaffold protein [Sphingomonas rhizophila]
MSEPLYTRDILRLASSIPYLDPIDRADGQAALRSPTCGATMTVAVRLDGEGRVVALSQSVSACAFGQATAALMGQGAIGIDRAAAARAEADVRCWLAGEAVDPWPGFEALEPARTRVGRHGAILLPFRTLLAAIEEAQ